MRASVVSLSLLLWWSGCRQTSVPATSAAPTLQPREARSGDPCVVPPKPPLPNPATEADCVSLGGRWEDRWDPGHAPPARQASDGGTEFAQTGWQVLGRGNRRFRGCTDLPAPDVGRPCRYPFDCLGACVNGACAARVEAQSGLGCGPRCRDGKLDTACYE